MDDDLRLDDLNLDDPAQPLPRRVPTVSMSPAAAALRKQERDAREAATGFQPPPPDAPPRFQLLTTYDLRAMPAPVWTIKGLLPEQGLAAFYGPSTSGKTFCLIDAVAAIAEGRDWFGYRVPMPRSVVCVELEGQEGFRRRIRAWEHYHERDFPANVRFILKRFRLNDPQDVLDLAASIDAEGGTDVVVIDTLNRSTPGADENSSRDMGLAIDGASELQTLVGGLVLLVAHTGKDMTKGLRGHSSLRAALDAAIEVTRNDGRRELRVDKVKDAEDGAVHGFRLEVVDLGADEDGDPITSCVVRQDFAPAEQHRPRPPARGNQRIIFDALAPLFRESRDFGKAGAPPTRPCIRLADAIEQTRDRLTVEPKRRSERAREAITGLIARRVVGCNEDWLWLT